MPCLELRTLSRPISFWMGVPRRYPSDVAGDVVECVLLLGVGQPRLAIVLDHRPAAATSTMNQGTHYLVAVA